MGDFNGDGLLDLVIANNQGSSTISFLPGHGDGSFGAPVNYPTGASPTSLTAADFNGDGKLDLAVTNFNSNTVSILLGNGDGTFQNKVDYAAGVHPFAVTTGDFNGDGQLDLIAADNAPGNSISLLLGNGNGTFQTAVSYPTGTSPTTISTGDFNRDGRLDLAVSNSNETTVSVFLQSPAVTLLPTSLNFGLQGVHRPNTPQTVTLTNTGSALLIITSITITGTNDTDFAQTSNCPISPFTLGVGDSCSITVVFSPTGTGTRTAAVTITDNAPDSPQMLPLTGIGVGGKPTLE